jgi:hypothetical protein
MPTGAGNAVPAAKPGHETFRLQVRVGQTRHPVTVPPDVSWSPSIGARYPARGAAGFHVKPSPSAAPRKFVTGGSIRSRARGLLALFLFTDVSPDDAPTRLMCGSHLAVPEFLAPYGEEGADADAEFWRPSALRLPVAHATGSAGDVFLCHPFIVHTATWPHRGIGPRMIAQPAVHAAGGFAVDGSDPSPVARAIVAGDAME